MGRAPCCDEIGVKKGPWTTEEDKQLMDYIEKHGHGSWRQLPKLAGLNRCGKSCRLRWTNYLRPDIKRGSFTEEEERLIIHLHSVLGNKWSQMANRLPGRTDNEIKNYWNTHLRKKLLQMGIDPVTHRPRTDLNLLDGLPNLLAAAANMGNMASGSWDQNALRLQADAANLARLQILQGLLHVMTSTSAPPPPPPYIGDYQFNGLQNQFVGLHNPINTAPYGFSNLDFQNVHSNLQASTESSFSLDGGCSVENGMEGNAGSSRHSNINTRVNSIPSLVSASPENTVIDQAEERITSRDLYAQSPVLGSFDAWEGLNLDDLDKELSWDNILDQASWPNEK